MKAGVAVSTGQGAGSDRARGMLMPGAMVGVIVAASFVWQTMHPLNGDVAWLMTAGQRLMAGQRLYVDILETNPPLAALLYLPAVWLGQVTSVPPQALLVAMVLGLALAALSVADQIMSQRGPLERRSDWWVIGALVLMVLPGGDFAEREHIALIVMLPMLAALGVRAAGAAPRVGWRVAAGIGGGVAMAIKPHFALAILVPAVWAAIAARSMRPIACLETVVAGAVVVAFWLLVGLLFPAFFTHLLPLAGIVYAGDRVPLLLLLFGRPTWPLWAFVVATIVLYRADLRRPELALPSASAGGFFLAYLVQGKGFSYHLLPATGLAAMVFLLAFAQRNGRGRGVGAMQPWLLAALIVALPVLSTPADAREAALLRLLQPLGPGLRVANITPELDVASPLVQQLGGTLVNSGPFLWMALGAIRIERTDPPAPLLARVRAIEQHERDVLRTDLLRAPPDIVLVGADGFDWLGWAQKDPAIASLLDNYQSIGEAGAGIERVTVLERDGTAGAQG